MEKQEESMESLKGTKNVVNNDSWFRDSAHYWVFASLPFAYAMACIRVASEMSKKAG